MTGLVESMLWSMVSNVEPTPTQKSGAVSSHNNLRSLLNTGQMAARIRGSYLSGSYARDTAIKPLDDVDVVFEIVPSFWNPTIGIFSSRPAPTQVLDSFANAIRYRYPVSSVYGQRRSVRLQLYHLDIDVVPAIPDAARPDFVYVPDRNAGDWILSSPKLHSANATRVNQKHGGRFKPLVKLLKFWNSNLPETIKCRSFMIETMAIRIFDSVALPTLESGAILFWDFMASQFNEPTAYRWTDRYGMDFGFLGITVPDAVGTGSNTAHGMEWSNGSALAKKARISRERLQEATRARTALSINAAVQEAFRV